MLPYLKCCAASIADQKEVQYEHIVVDAKSSDGTVEWLSAQPNMRYISEPDNGMYDAINKGMRQANGDILAYLNCDEQYLPGTLAFVKHYFASHPSVDMIFGNFFLVDNNGELISYRKSFKPRRQYILASALYTFTCTMFLRRRIIDDGLFFDDTYTCIADKVFVLDVIKKGYKIEHVKKYLSLFYSTDNNLSFTKKAEDELKRFNLSQKLTKSWPVQKIVLNQLRIIEKMLRGCYFEKKPIEYSLYIPDSMSTRVKKVAYQVSPLWKRS